MRVIRPFVLAPHPDLGEAALRVRVAEVAKGRADGGTSIRIQRTHAGSSKSLRFDRNALEGGSTRTETTRIVQAAVADILAAPMLDSEALSKTRDRESRAWHALSAVLHVLHPDKVSEAIAYPGSPWRRGWCIDGGDGTEILTPDVVETLFRDVAHALSISIESGDSMHASLHDALRFEPEDVNVLEGMRLVARMREEGVL